MKWRWVLPALVVLLLIPSTLWVVPTVTGPSLDCGGIEVNICDRYWRGYAATHELAKLPFTDIPLPITGVEVIGGTNEAPHCGFTGIWQWWVFGYGSWFDFC